ncbi:hypothetical protein [Nocardia nova]|uniref:hypothetical protein n=1 Tax=Nocardia nova TaxID=37330 RepID=UPI0033CBF2F1
MAYEVPTALIAGGFGLAGGVVTGTISSLVAPWANLRVKERELLRQRRIEFVAEWRAGIDELREIEHEIAPVIPVPGPAGSDGMRIVSVSPVPDPERADVTKKAWYSTLRNQMSTEAQQKVMELRKQKIAKRPTQLPDLLAAEVIRIEQQVWKLI